MLYIQSFCVTQNEVVRSLEQATGQKWQVENVGSEKYIEEIKNEMVKDPKDAEATENMVSVVGIVDANWESKDDFANSLLELKDENLEQVIEKIVHQ